jgi:hypothetical protein
MALQSLSFESSPHGSESNRAVLDPCGFRVPGDAAEIPGVLQIQYGDRLQAFGIDPVSWRPPADNSVIYSNTYPLLLKYLIAQHIAEQHVSIGQELRPAPVTRNCIAEYIGSMLGDREIYQRVSSLPPTFNRTIGMYTIEKNTLTYLQPENDITMKGQVAGLRHAFLRMRYLILARKV